MSDTPIVSFDHPAAVEQVVASAKLHPGQWTILALQDDVAIGRAYVGTGVNVYYRNERVPGIADILIRWPADRAA